MNVKETELSRERELVKTYKQRSLGMIQELHSKEMEIKKIHSRNVESHPELFGAFLCTCALLRILITLYLNWHILDFNDETLYSKEVLPAKDKHITKDSDKVDGLPGSEFYLLLSI